MLRLMPAVAQTRWARQAGGDGGQQINSIAVDGSANAYVVGFSRGVATFDTITVGQAGVAAYFIAKYTAQGDASWVRTITGGNLLKVVVDAAGDVYAVGSFSGTIALGGISLTSQGKGDLLLVKYNPQSTVLWARAGGSAPGSWLSGQALALDAAGNVYVGGALGGTAYPGGSAGMLTSVGKQNIIFAKYTSQGQAVWMRQGGGADNSGGLSALGVDAAGSIYLVGGFNDTVSFGATKLVSQSSTGQILLAKCSSTGDFLWARSEGGPGRASGQDIVVDEQGNSVIVGMLGGINTQQQATFGSTTFQVRGFGGFAMKHDAAGNVLWGSQLGSDNTNYSTGVALDRAGNVYVAGVYSSALPAWGPGGQLAYPGGNKNVYAVKYSPQGKVLAAQREGACDSAYYPCIAVTAAQDIFLAGFFAGLASFVSTLFEKTGGQLFLARLGNLSTPSTPDNFACSGVAPTPTPTPTPAPTPAPPPAPQELVIPNIITPNGDGKNDQLKITGLVNKEWQLVIYSRWGQQVYNSPGYEQNWEAAGQPAGTYYYRLWQPGGRTYQGWLDVVR